MKNYLVGIIGLVLFGFGCSQNYQPKASKIEPNIMEEMPTVVTNTPSEAGQTVPELISEVRTSTTQLYSQILVDGAEYSTTQTLTLDIVKRLRITYADVTGDKNEEAIVGIPSGGTAGDLGVLIYSIKEDKVNLIDKIEGYKIGALVENNHLVTHVPDYLDTDANCCPSFFKITTYNWNGKKFVSSTAKRISAEEFQKE
jgi:hypothetical protein